MIKNLKSFIFLLMAGMFGMLLTVSCGADDVLSDVEDAIGTDEPKDSQNNNDGNKGNEDSSDAEEADTVWTEYTQMGAQRLIGKWQAIYSQGKYGEYDRYLIFAEDGTVTWQNGSTTPTYETSTYVLRNDWEIFEPENAKFLRGHIAGPRWTDRLRMPDGKEYVYYTRCVIRIDGDCDELAVALDIPGACWAIDPTTKYRRVE